MTYAGEFPDAETARVFFCRRTPFSGGTPGREEFLDLAPEMIALPKERARQRMHMGRRGAGIGGAAVDVGDAAGHLRGALRRPLNTARDFLRRSALLFNRGGNRLRDLRNAADRAANI